MNLKDEAEHYAAKKCFRCCGELFLSTSTVQAISAHERVHEDWGYFAHRLLGHTDLAAKIGACLHLRLLAMNIIAVMTN